MRSNFCKFAAAAVLASTMTLSSVYAKNGLFVGGNVGFSSSWASFTYKYTYLVYYTVSQFAFFDSLDVGVMFGYHYELNDKLWLRGFFRYLSRWEFASNATASINNFTLGANAYYVVLDSKTWLLYAFGGLEAGVDIFSTVSNFYTKISGVGFSLPINIGVGVNIEQKYKIDLTFRIPTFPINLTLTNSVNVSDLSITGTGRFLDILLGYTYIF